MRGRYWLIDMGVQDIPARNDKEAWAEAERQHPNAFRHMVTADEGKHLLGFHNELTARLLCPIRYLKEFDADVEG